MHKILFSENEMWIWMRSVLSEAWIWILSQVWIWMRSALSEMWIWMRSDLVRGVGLAAVNLARSVDWDAVDQNMFARYTST